MPEILLRTKLSVPPLRASLVPRPHLIERLDQGLQLGHKLTLVSAPAGFGKTTLVCEWVGNLRLDAAKESQVNNRCAWLSLDEDDIDPVRFLTYFITALNQNEDLQVDIGEGMLDMLRSPQPPPTKVILTSLINEITNIPNRIVFVLDDYHSIVSAPVDDALNFLLEYLPPQMHLVIATRDDPNLNIPRLRGRDQLTELRAADLRFSAAEAAEFLNQVMGLDLSANDISALETRTEGWIAGLQLAAISMQGRKDRTGFIKSFTGSNRFILDYLIEEVLEQQPESVQNFLLQTAILDRITGFLCDTLTGQENGQKTLEMLDRANLFLIPLDEERSWYRYHHLFADLLRQRMHQTQPDHLTTLQRRASKWFEQNGLIDEAIEYSLRSNDFERASVLIEKQIDDAWNNGDHSKIRHWFAIVPKDKILSNPILSIFQAWSLFASGNQDAAERILLAVEKNLRFNNKSTVETESMVRRQLSDYDKKKFLGRIATIRAHLSYYRWDVENAMKYSQLALDCLPEQDIIWRNNAMVSLGDAYSISGDMPSAYSFKSEALEVIKATGSIYMILLASMRLAITLRYQGKLDEVLDLCEHQSDVILNSGLSQISEYGFLLAVWSEVLAEKNHLEKAMQLANKSRELTERDRDIGTISWSYLSLIKILFSRGDFTGVEESIQSFKDIAHQRDVPPWVWDLMMDWQVRLWLLQDKNEAAAQWISDRGLTVDSESSYQQEIALIILIRYFIAQKQFKKALGLSQRLLSGAESGGRTARIIEILLLQSLAYQADDKTAVAMIALERALMLAESGGYIRIFVDEGPPMAHLLYEALSREIAPDYVRQLLGAFPIDESEQVTSTKSKVDQSELIEPLSDREIEVLQLVAEGLTSREIAGRLYLSPHTIKVHTRNINGKLGVHNRVKAIAKARALGILPST